MTLKKYLMGLKWNTFLHYPPQGSDIYIYCRSLKDNAHKFIRVQKFNAIGFEPRNLVSSLNFVHDCALFWLPAKGIDEKQVKS